MFGSFDFSAISIIKALLIALALIIAIVGHEIMHGFVAYRYGDSTAKDSGRLSINPIKHIDPLGTIVLPLMLFVVDAPFLFGWAKPVPVNMHTVVNNGGYDGAIAVSLAGIVYNLSLAILSAIIIGLIGSGLDGVFGELLLYFLLQLTIYNVVLGVFNLMPIPPLDGSQALSYIGLRFGSRGIARFFNKIEPYGMIILIVVLITPLKVIFFIPVSVILTLLL